MNNLNKISLEILEVIKIRRNNTHLKTENKSCFCLSCRISGKSTFFYNDEQHEVFPGDILYIPQGACYEQNCESEELVGFHLNIYGEPLKEIKIFKPQNPIEICELFKSVYGHWNKKDINYYYLCLSDLYKIIAHTKIAPPTYDTNNYGIITPSIQYLQAHIYDTTLSLKTVCEQSYISQTSFIKHFRQHFNCSPIKYVNQVRIQKAKMLLDSMQYTREEIALLCGYDNVKHFYVVFKQITGMTTGQFIKIQHKTF